MRRSRRAQNKKPTPVVKNDDPLFEEIKIELFDEDKIAKNLSERTEVDELNTSLTQSNPTQSNPIQISPTQTSLDAKGLTARNWPPGEYVHFKLENGPEYKLHLDCIELIQTFKKCREASDPSLPLILKPLDINNRAPNSPPFDLNNEHILEFIETYFYEWLPELPKIEHFKKARIQIGDPLAYLMEKDVAIFEAFKEKMWSIYGRQLRSETDHSSKGTALSEKVEKKRMAIYIFGTLIFYFNDYLNCTMLAEKLAIYIACMLHDSTLDEIDFIMQMPTFAEFTKKEEREFYGDELP